jgi:hypothetical protein
MIGHALILLVCLACAPSYNQIEAYRMLIYKELREHIYNQVVSKSMETCDIDSERLGRILLRLPLLAELNTSIVEEIFFVGLIGMLNLTLFVVEHIIV